MYNAFHGDAEFKSQLIERAIAHRKADEFIAGDYGEIQSDGRFVGCSVGCSLFDVRSIQGVCVKDFGNHRQLAKALGVPEWLTLLQDSIFENLSLSQKPRFTERLFAAIPVGADVEPVRHRLTIRRLERLSATQQAALKKATDEHGARDAIEKVGTALDQVLSCHRAEIREIESVSDFWAAEAAAWAAAGPAAWSQYADDLIELLASAERPEPES